MTDSREPCKVKGCNRPVRSKELCKAHYTRTLTQETPDLVTLISSSIVPNKGKLCKAEECYLSAWCKGLCRSHYARTRSQEDPDLITSIRVSEGWVDNRGYRRLGVKSRYIFEHQQVMEEILGRPLEPGENVHHKNGIRDDNSPENLELWISSQPSGQRVENLVAWAEGILHQYKPTPVNYELEESW